MGKTKRSIEHDEETGRRKVRLRRVRRDEQKIKNLNSHLRGNIIEDELLDIVEDDLYDKN